MAVTKWMLSSMVMVNLLAATPAGATEYMEVWSQPRAKVSRTPQAVATAPVRKPTAYRAESAYAVEDTRSSSRDNALSLELLGRGGLYSLNYDHMVSSQVALGAGFSYWTLSDIGSTSISIALIPLYANFYFSPGAHRGYLSAGLDLAFGKVSDESDSQFGGGVLPVIGGGYEFRGDSGFLFRAAPYLFIGPESTAVSVGLSFGSAF